IAKLLEQHFFREGYTIIYSSTDNGVDKARRLIRQFNDLNVDGYIIAPPADFDPSEFAHLITSGKSIVYFDPPNAPTEFDRSALAEELTNLMLRALNNLGETMTNHAGRVSFS